ncbi:MAG: DNA-3-methyladenine glycosylase 2 family protein [Caldilineaceae bacterium]
MSFPLTEQTLPDAVKLLVAQDADLAQVVARFGHPPLWARPTGFPTLVYIILEQQVSLASAKAAFDRLLLATNPLTPLNFLALSDEQLRLIGFSRQKTRYCRLLAQAVLDGKIDFALLDTSPDEQVYAALTSLTGIGAWTANIYLLMALCRPDVWPSGDLALQIAVQQVKGLPTRPTVAQMDALGDSWRPFRSVAARILWHHYLSRS